MCLGASCCRLGASWGGLGAVLWRFSGGPGGAGRLSVAREPGVGRRACAWALAERPRRGLAQVEGVLGRSWGGLGAIIGRSWGVLGRLGASCGV